MTSKAQLRKQIRSTLSHLSNAVIQAESDLVARKLFALAEYKQARKILKKILDDKKDVYIPRCTKTQMQMLRLKSWQDFLALPRNSWDIPEPSLDDDAREIAFESKENALDLIIMPGLCFNDAGVRLGHGKGYYDKFLAVLFEKCKSWDIKRPRTVALSLSAQFIHNEVIPTDEYDIKPDVILRP